MFIFRVVFPANHFRVFKWRALLGRNGSEPTETDRRYLNEATSEESRSFRLLIDSAGSFRLMSFRPCLTRLTQTRYSYWNRPWPTLNHLDREFFPKALGYTPFREDRVADTAGGGVFILVKDTIIATEQKQPETDCEIIWIKLDIVAAKPLCIAAYYRPKEGDAKSLEELNNSLEKAILRKGNI